ncbi:MAG: hypothetical protein ACE5R6_07690 [Candidatus Heimdallarchaeota archaeon]
MTLMRVSYFDKFNGIPTSTMCKQTDSCDAFKKGRNRAFGARHKVYKVEIRQDDRNLPIDVMKYIILDLSGGGRPMPTTYLDLYASSTRRSTVSNPSDDWKIFKGWNQSFWFTFSLGDIPTN